jgi:PadR family transcriptional regulator, regulatory protein PadR
MVDPPVLGEFEHIVLLAILRLGDKAYGVTIRNEIQERIGREPAPGALYVTLDRLEDKGLLTSTLGDPTPQRGGRAKRYVKVSAQGMEALNHARACYLRLWEGLQFPGVSHA